MKIELNNKFRGISDRESTVTPRGGVRVGNVTKTREMLNINGDVIDPRTKRILVKNENEKLILPK